MSADKEYIKAMDELSRRFSEKRMALTTDGEDKCPHCGRRLRGYEGLRQCWCKFCGGKIRR